MREVSLDEIKRLPWEFEYAQNQTYEMCVEAVKRQGVLLKDVRWDELNLTKEQVYNLYLIAVRQDGFALKYVKLNKLSKDQLDEICREALRQNRQAIEFIENKDKYLEELNI